MAEINIYGDIVPFKYWQDNSEFDMHDLNAALSGVGELAEGSELIVNIHTYGGCTTTAFAIFNKLRRFASENKITVTTRIDGYCASSGVAIFLAGDKRVGNAYAQPFIHNAWTWMCGGDKNDAQRIAEDLVKVDNQIAQLYAERTSISVEDALVLMGADTTLTADQAMSLGFYTEMENVFVTETDALNSINQRKNIYNLSNMAKNKGAAKTVLNAVRKHLGLGAKNLVQFTATQEELDFYELEEGDIPAVGDKATFDGKAAGESNDGTYVMASGETYKFTGEDLSEIIAADEDAEDAEDADTENSAEQAQEIENLRAQVSTLTTSNNSLKTELKTAKAELKTANSLLNKVANLDLSEDDEEDDTDERSGSKGITPRESKNQNKKEAGRQETRNILESV